MFSCVRVFGCYPRFIQFTLASFTLNVHKNTLYNEVYIGRNNIHVELIRFCKQIATLLPLESLKWKCFVTDVFMKLGSLLSVRCRHCSMKSSGPALEIRGVVVQARAFFYGSVYRPDRSGLQCR